MEFATVTSMEELDFNAVDPQDPIFSRHATTAIATDHPSETTARQLDIRYTETATYVTPIVDDPLINPESYSYDYLLSPQTCAAHYLYLNPIVIPPAPNDEGSSAPEEIPLVDTETPLSE